MAMAMSGVHIHNDVYRVEAPIWDPNGDSPLADFEEQVLVKYNMLLDQGFDPWVDKKIEDTLNLRTMYSHSYLSWAAH
jgi:hypothetical protein